MVHITRAPKLLGEAASVAKTHIFYYQQELAATVRADFFFCPAVLRAQCSACLLSVQQGAKLKRWRQIFIATSPSRFRLLTASKLLHKCRMGASERKGEREPHKVEHSLRRAGRQADSQVAAASSSPFGFACRVRSFESHFIIFVHLSYARWHFILLAWQLNWLSPTEMVLSHTRACVWMAFKLRPRCKTTITAMSS